MSVDKRFFSPDEISICVRSRLSWGVRGEEIEMGFSGLTPESDSCQQALHYFLKLDNTTSSYKLSRRIKHTVHMCSWNVAAISGRSPTIWCAHPDFPPFSPFSLLIFTSSYLLPSILRSQQPFFEGRRVFFLAGHRFIVILASSSSHLS